MAIVTGGICILNAFPVSKKVDDSIRTRFITATCISLSLSQEERYLGAEFTPVIEFFVPC